MTSAPGRPRLFAIGRGRLWLAVLVAPPLALASWRAGRLAELAAPAVQAEWDAFRADMRPAVGSLGTGAAKGAEERRAARTGLAAGLFSGSPWPPG